LPQNVPVSHEESLKRTFHFCSPEDGVAWRHAGAGVRTAGITTRHQPSQFGGPNGFDPAAAAEARGRVVSRRAWV